MRKAQAHFDLAQLIAQAIDLSVDAEPVQRAALELKVQALANAQKAGILPAAVPAGSVRSWESTREKSMSRW